VTFYDDAGGSYHKSVSFYTETAGTSAVWRTMLGGSCKGAPTVTKDAVYIGATDGKLYAIQKATGKVKWSFPTGGEIIGQPLVVGGVIYVGSGDHRVYAVDSNGKRKWAFETSGAVYCPPVYAKGMVLFGSNDTDFYAVDAKTGERKWVCTEPEYSMETKPFVDGDTVYFGAWDQYVYAVDVDTGQLKWKCKGQGSATLGAARYFSPADCGPVATGGNVFIADRDYDLSIIDAAKGVIVQHFPNCAGTGISEDGKSVYLRKDDGNVEKLDSEGKRIWIVPANVGSLPEAPVEKGGVVYVCSNLGCVQALKATDGTKLWEYNATPKLYVMSNVEADGGVVYVAGMDGSVTAIKTN
jgi:outer membrane protein assembly factor BamB